MSEQEPLPADAPAYVYIVRCADDTLYTGWTTDLARRLRQHNRGRGARYTRSRRPVKLVYSEAQPNRRAALRRELAIKRLSRPQKLALIRQAPPPTDQTCETTQNE